MSRLCVVFLCDEPYFYRFKCTCAYLRAIGNYSGPIVLILGDDLHGIEEDPFIQQYQILVKRFPKYPFTPDFLEKQRRLNRPVHWYQKRFQFHKFYLFDTFFKQWDYVFYIDCGIHILGDISSILSARKPNTLLANRDGVDGQTAGWCIPETPGEGLKIGDQFIKIDPYYQVLKEKFNMAEKYFQTTVMLFDTQIIDDSTVSNLYELLLTYPISLTNDQPIIALYFTQIQPAWEQLQRKNETTYFYDYVRCVDAPYIMVKSKETGYLRHGYNP